MINIIVSILFLLFVTSLTLTLFTIIKHTEKILPVLESFKWPLVAVPQADKLGPLIKYEVEEKIADKLISIDDLDNKYNIYFEDEKTKKTFIFEVNNYDFIFYYAKISNNNYYVPSNYVYLNSKTNVKPQNSQYSLGIVLSENKDNNIQTSENINLFDLITHNIDWKFNGGDQQIINFITPVKSLSYNNFITGKANIYSKSTQNNYTYFYTYFYIDKGNIIHILSKENNNELLKLRRNENYQLVNVDNSSNTYIPSMLLFNIGFDVTLVKLMMKNKMAFTLNKYLATTIEYYNDSKATVTSANVKDYYYTINGERFTSGLPEYIFFPNSILRNKFISSKSSKSYVENLKFVEIAITSLTNPKTYLYYIDDEMFNSGNFDATEILTLKHT